MGMEGWYLEAEVPGSLSRRWEKGKGEGHVDVGVLGIQRRRRKTRVREEVDQEMGIYQNEHVAACDRKAWIHMCDWVWEAQIAGEAYGVWGGGGREWSGIGMWIGDCGCSGTWHVWSCGLGMGIGGPIGVLGVSCPDCPQ